MYEYSSRVPRRLRPFCTVKVVGQAQQKNPSAGPTDGLANLLSLLLEPELISTRLAENFAADLCPVIYESLALFDSSSSGTYSSNPLFPSAALFILPSPCSPSVVARLAPLTPKQVPNPLGREASVDRRLPLRTRLPVKLTLSNPLDEGRPCRRAAHHHDKHRCNCRLSSGPLPRSPLFALPSTAVRDPPTELPSLSADARPA